MIRTLISTSRRSTRLLVVCSLERTHDSDPTPAIFIAIPTPATNKPLVSVGVVGVGVVRNCRESLEPESAEDGLRMIPTSDDFGRLRTTPDVFRLFRMTPDDSG